MSGRLAPHTRRVTGSVRHFRTVKLGLAAAALSLLVGACGIGGAAREEPAISTPYEVTRIEQLALRITKDTPERLWWEVTCLRAGRYSKVTVHYQSGGSKGTASGEGAECEEAGQAVLSGDVAKSETPRRGEEIRLSLQAATADGTEFIDGQGTFTQGSDGRLRSR